PRSAVARVGPRRRFKAALVDAALLCGIDAIIVWFTLRICALTIGQAATLPLLPLATFCVILDVGYVLMFTATSGQTVGKMAAGTWAAGVAATHFGREDPGQVVVDEVAGQLVTLLLTGAALPGAVIGFFAFRIFDILKPWPANRFERLPGGVGIMADDLMAGL